MTDPDDHPTADVLDAMLAALADGDHELADAVVDAHAPDPPEPHVVPARPE